MALVVVLVVGTSAIVLFYNKNMEWPVAEEILRASDLGTGWSESENTLNVSQEWGQVEDISIELEYDEGSNDSLHIILYDSIYKFNSSATALSVFTSLDKSSGANPISYDIPHEGMMNAYMDTDGNWLTVEYLVQDTLAIMLFNFEYVPPKECKCQAENIIIEQVSKIR
jgi:hypothetical protein